MSEAVLAQYVVSVDLHTTYTKELFIFNYEILFKMKSEYFTLKITNLAILYVHIFVFIVYMIFFILLYMFYSVENPK
jgi:hypothetical protein